MSYQKQASRYADYSGPEYDTAMADMVGDLMADGMGREEAEALAHQQYHENLAAMDDYMERVDEEVYRDMRAAMANYDAQREQERRDRERAYAEEGW